MDLKKTNDTVMRRLQAISDRVNWAKERDLYFYNQPITELRGGARVLVDGREMGMYASYLAVSAFLPVMFAAPTT